MRAAMLAAEVGDDVYHDDPTVNLLEETLAHMAGYQAGVFMPSGTQSNLVALMTHCARGEEYLVGQEAHTYRYEGGGAAVLGSIQPQPIENLPDGSIDLAKLEAAIKPDDSHFAITRLIALENTISGRVLSAAYVAAVKDVADRHGLLMHLDGARAFNAAVAAGVPIRSICQPFDSTSICLSKGLGTPVGSVLCGGQAFAERARRWRKMLGGGMRQAGVLAAAGLYALEHHVERLAEDHANARRLAEGLGGIAGFKVSPPQTNILFVDIPNADVAALDSHLRSRGICCTLRAHTRLVTHLDVDQAAIDETVDAFKRFYA
jgi:threonine aldolase